MEGGGQGFQESGLALSLRGEGDHLLSHLCCRLLQCHGQVMQRILSGIKQRLHLVTRLALEVVVESVPWIPEGCGLSPLNFL